MANSHLWHSSGSWVFSYKFAAKLPRENVSPVSLLVACLLHRLPPVVGGEWEWAVEGGAPFRVHSTMHWLLREARLWPSDTNIRL